ncbi:MAG: hypothetical protein QMC67_12345 [Candidatus Wallbacteria bacterium]
MQSQFKNMKFKFNLSEKNSQKAMALPLVMGVIFVLFISITAVFYMTREETGQITRTINKNNTENLAEALHAFFTAKTYSKPWADRFFKQPQVFGTGIENNDWQKELNESIKKGFEKNTFKIETFFNYHGKIFTVNDNKNKIFAVYVLITGFDGKPIGSYRYYDLYKRNILDTFKEQPSLCLTDMTDENGNKISYDQITSTKNFDTSLSNPVIKKDLRYLKIGSDDEPMIDFIKDYAASVKKPVIKTKCELCNLSFDSLTSEAYRIHLRDFHVITANSTLLNLVKRSSGGNSAAYRVKSQKEGVTVSNAWNMYRKYSMLISSDEFTNASIEKIKNAATDIKNSIIDIEAIILNADRETF